MSDTNTIKYWADSLNEVEAELNIDISRITNKDYCQIFKGEAIALLGDSIENLKQLCRRHHGLLYRVHNLNYVPKKISKSMGG